MKSSRRAPVRSSTIGLTLLAGFIALSTVGTVPARAQYGYVEGDLLLPPRAVVWRLNDRGFTEVTRPRFDGRAYVVEATGPYGDRVRLFVDARDGAVLGRQRLDAPPPPPPPPIRIARPSAPGYGWTEGDEQFRTSVRDGERLIPPGRIPGGEASGRASYGEALGRQPRVDVAARPEGYSRAEPADRNPSGLNPDARTGDSRRPSDIPPARRVAKVAPPAKPASPRLTPEAPRPAVTATEPAPETTAPPVAAIEPQKPLSSAPAANPSRREDAQATPAKNQAWSDPPAEKKAVRVIGGATVVPGATDRDQPSPDRPAE